MEAFTRHATSYVFPAVFTVTSSMMLWFIASVSAESGTRIADYATAVLIALTILTYGVGSIVSGLTRLYVFKEDAIAITRTFPKKRTTTLRYSEISSYRIVCGIAGRIFNRGTIILYTRTGQRKTLMDIGRPSDAVAILNKKINKTSKKNTKL